jgi:hypothetical protein
MERRRGSGECGRGCLVITEQVKGPIITVLAGTGANKISSYRFTGPWTESIAPVGMNAMRGTRGAVRARG